MASCIRVFQVTRRKASQLSSKVVLVPWINRSAYKFLSPSRHLSYSRSLWNKDESNSKIVDLVKQTIQSTKLPAAPPPSQHKKAFELSLQKEKSLEQFVTAIEDYKKINKRRVGHMEFIRVSLEYMERFDLQGDVEAYNAMLDIFPRGRFEHKSLFDAIWPQMHPQLDLALEILLKMEENLVMPNEETLNLSLTIFGRNSYPHQKVKRLRYWLKKLEQMFPHPLPKNLPENEVELCELAIARMAKHTLPIITYQEENKENNTSFIIGSQTEDQKAALEKYDIDVPVYVEGPYLLWIRRLTREYYVLRAHGSINEGEPDKTNEETILAVCMTNSDSDEAQTQDTLWQWIGKLQQQTPNLSKMKVVFNLNESQLKKEELFL